MAGIKILGIAGSLRKASFNKAALRAAQKLVPQGASLDILDIDGLPGFSRPCAHRHGRIPIRSARSEHHLSI